jgi:hypothetical protein
LHKLIFIQSKNSNKKENTNFTARQNCEHDRIKLTIVVAASRRRVAVDADDEKSSECKTQRNEQKIQKHRAEHRRDYNSD